MIQIVNWLLTRKCNLNCSYCAINRDYENKPSFYPDMKHYMQNEMDTEFVIEGLKRIKTHNPNSFHIFYGGEPFLRKDLKDIVKFCNENEIHYTIITNNSDAVQSKIDELFKECGEVKGLTSSIDPIILMADDGSDRYKKSLAGFKRLKEYKKYVEDVVAEITVDKDSVFLLKELVEKLTEIGISSSITFLDIAKNEYYDFSNVTDESELVEPTFNLQKTLEILRDGEYDIHMKDSLLMDIFKILPSNLDCKIEKNVHNLTIDADGSVRLCLRIRGTSVTQNNLLDYISTDGSIHPTLREYFSYDKETYCKGCNWTCMIMSKQVDEGINSSDNLIHTDRR